MLNILYVKPIAYYIIYKIWYALRYIIYSILNYGTNNKAFPQGKAFQLYG